MTSEEFEVLREWWSGFAETVTQKERSEIDANLKGVADALDEAIEHLARVRDGGAGPLTSRSCG